MSVTETPSSVEAPVTAKVFAILTGEFETTVPDPLQATVMSPLAPSVKVIVPAFVKLLVPKIKSCAPLEVMVALCDPDPNKVASVECGDTVIAPVPPASDIVIEPPLL